MDIIANTTPKPPQICAAQSSESLGCARAAKCYTVAVTGGEGLPTAPFMARFEVDEQLAREIVRLAAVVDENHVYKLERPDYRAQFLRHDPEPCPRSSAHGADLIPRRTDRDMLVVTVDEFFFSAFCKNTDVAVETEAQSIAVLADHFGVPYRYSPLSGVSIGQEPSTQLDRDVDRALLLRAQALALLQEAQAIDGLKPFTVTHTHREGESTYVVWAPEPPTEGQVEAVLESSFEPYRDETLVIEGCHTLEELTGVAIGSRLLDIVGADDHLSQAPA